MVTEIGRHHCSSGRDNQRKKVSELQCDYSVNRCMCGLWHTLSRHILTTTQRVRILFHVLNTKELYLRQVAQLATARKQQSWNLNAV